MTIVLTCCKKSCWAILYSTRTVRLLLPQWQKRTYLTLRAVCRFRPSSDNHTSR